MPKRSSTADAPQKPLVSRRGSGSKRSTPSNVTRAKRGKTPAARATASKHTEQAQRLVMEAWPEIIQGLIKKAAEGGTQQTKLLLELCDLASRETPDMSDEHKQQLCDALLAGWNLTSAAPKDNPTVKNPACESELQGRS